MTIEAKPRAAVYIDGFNFHYAAFVVGEHGDFRRLDLCWCPTAREPTASPVTSAWPENSTLALVARTLCCARGCLPQDANARRGGTVNARCRPSLNR